MEITDKQINELKQLDRIEYLTKKNALNNWVLIIASLSIVMLLFSLNFVVKGILYLNLYYFEGAFLTLFVGTLLFLMGMFFFYIGKKKFETSGDEINKQFFSVEVKK